MIIGSIGYFGTAAGTAGEPQSSVRVTLQSGEVVNFEYASFDFDWIPPSRIKEPMSCQEYEINKENIDEVYVSGEFDNICENKKDWQVIVKLTDETVYRGFLHVANFAVKGIVAETGEEKSIPFKDLKRIKFRR